MKIAAATVTMQSGHYAATRDETSETLNAWVGRPPDGGAARSAPAPTTVARISAAGTAAANAAAQKDVATANDPVLGLLVALIEKLTGRPVKVYDATQLQAAKAQAQATPAAAAAAPSGAGFGIEYDYHAVHQEVEQTSFSAQGTVRTADGKEISLQVDLTMARSYSEENSVSVRAGDARRKDPLVINFGGSAAQLSNQTFRFDLLGDGNAADVPLLGGGSGFLALDLNGNGRIDSGTELFGPNSGSGFADLARYDADHNGWIDENDPVFKRLQTWTPDASGAGTLTSLQDRGVGALFLGKAATPFELRGDGNRDLGAVRDSGVYLTEAGQAGTLQEVDLTV